MIPLPKEKIDEIFSKAKTQYDYWGALYRIAFPNWDNIENIKGFPHVSENTNKYLFAKCIEWDDNHDLKGKSGLPVLSGGLWVDKGFGTDYALNEDWTIDTSGVKITLKKSDEKIVDYGERDELCPKCGSKLIDGNDFHTGEDYIRCSNPYCNYFFSWGK